MMRFAFFFIFEKLILILKGCHCPEDNQKTLEAQLLLFGKLLRGENRYTCKIIAPFTCTSLQ